MDDRQAREGWAAGPLEETLGVAIDRRAEVPVGVQIAWALRTRIGDGSLKPGERLPGLRELAEATGVNVNTARAVYQRLEREGLIDSQQGSGTFVASDTRRSSTVSQIAASAASEAYDSGIQPHEVAAALYVLPGSPSGDPDIARRRLLRRQIAALELAAGELEAESGLAAATTPPRLVSGPRLLGADDLEQVRGELIRRLANVQVAIDESIYTGDEEPRRQPAKAKSAKKASRRSPRPRNRPAPAET